MKYVIISGEIKRALENVEDHVPVLFNVELPDQDNWDTFDVTVSNTSYMCQGETGCTHTEPEMYWDIVFFVRHPGVGENSITRRLGDIEDDPDEQENS